MRKLLLAGLISLCGCTAQQPVKSTSLSSPQDPCNCEATCDAKVDACMNAKDPTRPPASCYSENDGCVENCIDQCKAPPATTSSK